MQGRAEYHEKYAATAAGLNAAGLDVLSLEWRGQGLSDRLTPNPFTSHIGLFSDYQRDVVELVVAAHDIRLPRPWHLLSHSMGGAIGLASLLSDLPVQSAVFSAPMWGINLPWGIPAPMASGISALAQALGCGAALAPASGGKRPFVLTQSFDANLLTYNAHEWGRLVAHAAEQPALTLGGVTYGWLRAALRECRRLAALPSPDLPALIILGQEEAVVSAPAIRQRAAAWPRTRLIELEGAKHEAMIERPAIRQRFLDAVIEHFLPTG